MDPRPCHCTYLRRAARAVSEHYDRILAPTGLRAVQLSLLRAVAYGGASNVSQIADLMALDRTTLARRLRPLLARGLLRDAPGTEDRRTREIIVTAKGLAAIERAEPLWLQAQQVMEGCLDASGLESLLQALEELDAAA
jgi:DNA-binding MarR family transcriptional regulator